jgi:hypothetical protein
MKTIIFFAWNDAVDYCKDHDISKDEIIISIEKCLIIYELKI